METCIKCYRENCRYNQNYFCIVPNLEDNISKPKIQIAPNGLCLTYELQFPTYKYVKGV